jgi:hypothetical protein
MLDEREHTVAPAKTEEADFKKRDEEAEEDHFLDHELYEFHEFAVEIATEGGEEDDEDRRDTESPDGEGASDGNPDGVAIQLGTLA